MEKNLFLKLNSLVLEGEAKWVKTELSCLFGNYIDNLPWSGNRLDFKKINRSFIQLDFYISDSETIQKFIKKSVLSEYRYLAFLYSNNDPILVTTVEKAAKNIERYITYSGDGLAFGFDDFHKREFKNFIHIYDWKATVFKKP